MRAMQSKVYVFVFTAQSTPKSIIRPGKAMHMAGLGQLLLVVPLIPMTAECLFVMRTVALSQDFMCAGGLQSGGNALSRVESGTSVPISTARSLLIPVAAMDSDQLEQTKDSHARA